MLPCYKCIYRRNIPGDSHLRCIHPSLKSLNPFGEFLQYTKDAIPEMLLIGIRYFGIKNMNAYGIQKGWFNWPFNFDPTWAEECSEYIEKEKKNE